MARFAKPKSSRRFYQAKPRNALDPSPFEVQIEGFSHDGRGLSRHNGKTLFVDGALPGEQVRVQLTQHKSKYAQARTLEVLESSSERVEPRCPHFAHCGGCQLQHLADPAQIHIKQQQALDQLQRIGKLSPEQILEPLDGEHWGYRRRVRLGIVSARKGSAWSLGFRRQQSNKLVAIDHCPVLDERGNQLLEQINPLLNQLLNPQALSHVELCLGDSSAALLIRHPKALAPEDQQSLLNLAEQQQWRLYLQPGAPDSVHCLNPGQPPLSYQLDELTLQFEPGDFTQVNASVNRQMVQMALQLLHPEPRDRILDLFCGLGNFTLPLARHAGHVVGIEAQEAMVQRGRSNAELNGLANVEFHAADLTQSVEHRPWFGRGFNKVLLDPPRAGALEVIEPLARLAAEQILYISCDPATLARDAGALAEQGYRLQQWTVMNMFPQTTHVESIALFQR